MIQNSFSISNSCTEKCQIADYSKVRSYLVVFRSAIVYQIENPLEAILAKQNYNIFICLNDSLLNDSFHFIF